MFGWEGGGGNIPINPENKSLSLDCPIAVPGVGGNELFRRSARLLKGVSGADGGGGNTGEMMLERGGGGSDTGVDDLEDGGCGDTDDKCELSEGPTVTVRDCNGVEGRNGCGNVFVL